MSLAFGWLGGWLRRGLVGLTLEGCFGDPVASVLPVSTASSLVAESAPVGLTPLSGHRVRRLVPSE